MPEKTKSQNLMRATLMPANRAASGCSPVANIARPSGVACSTMPHAMASTMKITVVYDSSVPETGTTPILVSQAGQYGRPDRPAVMPQVAEQRPGHAQHRGDGQVDLARHHDQRHRQGHDRDVADVYARVEQRDRTGEGRRI